MLWFTAPQLVARRLPNKWFQVNVTIGPIFRFQMGKLSGVFQMGKLSGVAVYSTPISGSKLNVTKHVWAVFRFQMGKLSGVAVYITPISGSVSLM